MYETIAMNAAEERASERPMDATSLFKLSYGLFVLTAREGEKDNGCIINTAIQVAETPNKCVSISVNKQNHTHDMIMRTGRFNVSVLAEDAPFALFERFGFQSGRTADKFGGFDDAARAENGILYLTRHASALLSGRVLTAQDLGSHTLFVAELTTGRVLSDTPSVTYAYYFAHIKPKKQAVQPKKRGFVCKICGYVHEGDTLPADFVCPVCKHGAADFEPLSDPAPKGYVCKICGYVYEGDPLPADFICPICKHGAADFEPLS